MLLVKTSLKLSKIHGIGVFAAEKIKKGTLVWKFDSQFDISFDKEDVAAMPETKRDFIMHYGYLSKATGRYILSIDNSRFLNHSANDNLSSVDIAGEPEGGDVANRDIDVGEELIINYKEFDANDAANPSGYSR